MLLIDNDKPKVGERGKEGGAGADDHLGLTSADALPLIKTLTICQAAVEDGDSITETGEKIPFNLGGESNFRHEDQDIAAFSQGQGCGPQIDFGLAAAGDAVLEEGGVSFRLNCRC